MCFKIPKCVFYNCGKQRLHYYLWEAYASTNAAAQPRYPVISEMTSLHWSFNQNQKSHVPRQLVNYEQCSNNYTLVLPLLMFAHFAVKSGDAVRTAADVENVRIVRSLGCSTGKLTKKRCKHSGACLPEHSECVKMLVFSRIQRHPATLKDLVRLQQPWRQMMRAVLRWQWSPRPLLWQPLLQRRRWLQWWDYDYLLNKNRHANKQANT